jgi:glycosyltransferase involved in cell wall biosynthesis
MFAPRSINAPATVNRVCLLGSYNPGEPGLSAFVSALRESLIADRPGLTVDVVRSDSNAAAAGRPEAPEVVHRVEPGADGGRAAAKVANSYDAAVIHYESAAYADDEGGQVLDILEWITIPVICVMHEVHLDPTPRQRFIVEALTSSSDAIVVLTETGRQTLLTDYGVEPRKLMVIRHGGLPHPPRSAAEAPSRRPTIVTWGRLTPAKGVHIGIDALARMHGMEPAPRYIAAGLIDPAYRQTLMERAESLGLADRVEIGERHLSARSLAALVDSADVVLLPYAASDRTASAVLSEALCAGKPIVSTPFPHATESLGDGRRGLLVPCDDPTAMAEALTRILTEPGLRESMAEPDATTATTHSWPLAASQYRQLFNALFRRPTG